RRCVGRRGMRGVNATSRECSRASASQQHSRSPRPKTRRPWKAGLRYLLKQGSIQRKRKFTVKLAVQISAIWGLVITCYAAGLGFLQTKRWSLAPTGFALALGQSQTGSATKQLSKWPCVANKRFVRDSQGKPIRLSSTELMDRLIHSVP